MEEVELGGYKRSNLVIVTFKMPEDELECLDKAVKLIGLTHRSELIRMSIRKMLREIGTECANESTDS